MGETGQVRISLAAMAAWVLPTGLIVAVAGAYPTWVLAGADGLKAQAWAGAIVLATLVGNAVVMWRSAARGIRTIALRFLGGAMVRLAVMGVLSAAAAWLVGLRAVPLLAWLAIFYATMFAAEAAVPEKELPWVPDSSPVVRTSASARPISPGTSAARPRPWA